VPNRSTPIRTGATGAARAVAAKAEISKCGNMRRRMRIGACLPKQSLIIAAPLGTLSMALGYTARNVTS
jgi:hypothetical protein